MATIDQNLQRIQTVHTDMANSVTNKFGYTFSSGNGFEQIASKLGDISTDINTQLASLLGNFTATIQVTTVAGAAVTATLGQSVLTAIANNQGVATINVDMRGTYSIQSTTSNGSGKVAGVSNISQVEITTKNETQSTTVSFANLTINIPSGSTYQLTDNTTTYSGTSSGIDITYYLPNLGTWNISCTNGTESSSDSVTVSDYISYSKTLSYVKVYGVIWDKTNTSTVLTRTDDSANFSNPDPFVNDGNHSGSSPFDNLYPWNGMVKETFADGNVMVKIPKFWYKITNSDSQMTIQIADGAKTGFKVSPAHQARYSGDIERDYVYLGKYKCNSSYKSVSGVNPITNITRATARSGCRKQGTSSNIDGYYQQDFHTFWTVRMLYIVEFANWNSQEVLGYGCGTATLSGSTNSMPYHTGTINSSRTAYETGVQYRNIEAPYGIALEYVDGIYFNGSNYLTINIVNNPNNFSDSVGGVSIGTRSGGAGFIKDLATGSGDYDWAMYPPPNGTQDTSGGGYQYISDWCAYNYYLDGIVLSVGGSTGHKSMEYGLFFLNGSQSDSYADSRSTRLIYLPPTN